MKSIGLVLAIILFTTSAHADLGRTRSKVSKGAACVNFNPNLTWQPIHPAYNFTFKTEMFTENKQLYSIDTSTYLDLETQIETSQVREKHTVEVNWIKCFILETVISSEIVFDRINPEKQGQAKNPIGTTKTSRIIEANDQYLTLQPCYDLDCLQVYRGFKREYEVVK
jgi:hypothetical protein